MKSNYRQSIEYFLNHLGYWKIFDVEDIKRETTFIEAITLAKSPFNAKVMINNTFLSMNLLKGDNYAVIINELESCGLKADLITVSHVISSLISIYPTRFIAKQYYFGKRCNGVQSIKDPVMGDSLIVKTGRNILKSWRLIGINTKTVQIVKKVNAIRSGVLGGINKYIVGKVMFAPVRQKNGELISRYCGASLDIVAHRFGYQEYLSRAWRAKPPAYNIPSFYTIIREFRDELVNQGFDEFADTMCNSIQEQWKQYDENYHLAFSRAFVTNLDCFVTQINELLIDTKFTAARKRALFYLLLLVKALYIERVLSGIGISHPHLHPGNITLEAVPKSVRITPNMQNTSNVIVFDCEEIVKNYSKYTVVLRIIDFQGVAVVRGGIQAQQSQY